MIRTQKEDWFRRVNRKEISYVMISEETSENIIDKSVSRFKEHLEKHIALLNEPAFDVNELREGGSHHEDYVSHPALFYEA